MSFKKTWRLGAATLALSALALTGCSASASSSDKADSAGGEGISIALSNGFVNGWRLTLINKFEAEAKKLQKDGIVKEFSSVNAPGENSATEQASQIRSLMIQDPDVLVVIPASSTALVPAVEEACDAGITVVVLDADMDAPCATIVRNDYGMWGEVSLQPALDAIDGKGNIVLNRGVIGSQPEEEFYARQKEILKDYPDVKIAAEINGFCDSSTAQKEITGILGSLPEIAAVPGCIGGMGIVQAFESAGRDLPAVVFDTDGKSLKFWKDEGIDNGSFSALTDPGQGVAAIYVALAKLAGKDVPQEIILPLVQIDKADLDYWVEQLSADEYAAYPWDEASISAAIDAINAGEDAVAPAIK
ncbi:monosaccharide ABC transporter substrate-binding protein, CUT2 family [Paramicrobacterium humi]|uniref:Monosaccharide ABC transporter substrate-binding protein, CUT2 family n=1 Tax=Paramicrobacterium humi TaxID=640635 RepID=A0A1H4KYL0_9MICO|nr:ABC transporter substrate-binding protein [Microbacterium humi]SEB63185.1 monosaccharide ABC transporter substrate-binding protein, CUT2 family [Microbacterium humi]